MKNLIAAFLLAALIASCTWNNEEDLYSDGTGANCDGSAEVTFSGTVMPIISARCLSCHGATTAANMGSGVRLDTHELVKLRAGNGSLAGVINHASGYPQMPQASAKLSDCQISLIEEWINNGAPNN